VAVVQEVTQASQANTRRVKYNPALHPPERKTQAAALPPRPPTRGRDSQLMRSKTSTTPRVNIRRPSLHQLDISSVKDTSEFRGGLGPVEGRFGESHLTINKILQNWDQVDISLLSPRRDNSFSSGSEDEHTLF